MEIKKTLIKLPELFKGYTVNIRYMHGDSDFFSDQTYYFSDDFELEVALKFFTTPKKNPFSHIIAIADEYGSIERYDEWEGEHSSDDVINDALKCGIMTRDQILKFWELASEYKISSVTDACGLPFVYRCAKVNEIKIQYYDGTDMYDVETEYNRKPEYDWQKGENNEGKD